MREVFGALTYCPLYKPSVWKLLLRQFAISSSFSASLSLSTSLSITRHSLSLPILFLMKLRCSLLVGRSLKNCLQNSFWAVFKRLLTKFLWYLKMVCACSDGFFFQILKSLCFFGISYLSSFDSQGFSAITSSGWKFFISGACNSRVVLKTLMKTLYILFPSSQWYKLLQSWFERLRLILFASNFLLFLLIKLCFLFLGSTKKLVVCKTIKWSISTDGETKSEHLEFGSCWKTHDRSVLRLGWWLVLVFLCLTR